MSWVEVPVLVLFGCVALGFAAGWWFGRDARDDEWLMASREHPIRLSGSSSAWQAVTTEAYADLAARRAWAEPAKPEAKPDIRISEPYPAALQTSRRPE